MSQWRNLLKNAVDILQDTFADDVKVFLKNGTIVNVKGIQTEDDVIINSQYGEIIDYNLCLSISEHVEIKKEMIKHIEYKNRKYTILKDKRSEGFIKLYLRE